MRALKGLPPPWQGVPFRRWEYGAALGAALGLFVLTYPAYVLSDARLFTRPWLDGHSSEFAFYPWDRFIAERLRAGEIPLWNPRAAGGSPFLANYQSSLFFPPKLLLYLWNALDTFLALKFLLAAVGTYRLARWLRLSPPAAALAMTAVALSSYLVLYLNQPHTNAECLLPFLLFAVGVYLHRGGGPRLAAAAAAVALVVLGGHPEATFYGLLAAGLFGLHEAFLAGRDRIPPRRRWVGLPAVFLLGLALGAVQLLPFLEYLPRAWHIHAPGVGGIHRDALGALELLVPRLRGGGTYDFPFGVGGPVVALAVYALTQVRHPRGRALFLGGYALIFLGLYLGLPPFHFLARLPWVGEAGNLKYPGPTVNLVLALLAGMGLDRLGRRAAAGAPGPAFSRVSLLLAVAAAPLPLLLRLFLRLPLDLGAATLAAALLLFPLPFLRGAAAGRLPPLSLPLAVGGAAAGALMADLAVPPPGAALALAAAVLVLPLALPRLPPRRGLALAAAPALLLAVWHVATDRVLPPPEGGRPLPDAARPPPVVRALRRLARETGGGPYRITGEPLALPANQAMVYGLEDVRSFDALYVDRFMQYLNVVNGLEDYRETLLPLPPGIGPAEALARLLASNTDWRFFEETKRCGIRVERLTHPLVDLLGVRFFLFSPFFPPARIPRASHLVPVYAAHGFRILWNRRAAPRAFLVHRARVLGDWRAVRRALGAPGFEGRREALLETPLPGPLPPGPPPAGEEVRVEARGSHLLRLRVRARAPAVLVVTDNYYPGWEARRRVGGGWAALRIFPVDLCFRGVYLPPGEHEIEFRYRPRSVRAGLLAGAGALAVLAALAALGRRRRRS